MKGVIVALSRQGTKHSANFSGSAFNSRSISSCLSVTQHYLFGPPVSGESRNGAGFFGTSMSPALNGCSIFGDTTTNQQSTGSDEFSFSFGATSPNTNPNRSAAFSLF